MSTANAATPPAPDRHSKGFLGWVEWLGNLLPDPVALFLLALLMVWVLSALLAPVPFTEIDPQTMGKDPKTGLEREQKTIQVRDQLTATALVRFLTSMVGNFAQFPPLGLVLVALLGVGVAEHTGFVNATLKGLIGFTPRFLLTPMVLFVGILSHLAADSGYVIVIPLGGVIFYAAGRHPLAGIAAAFAGVAGGFSASLVPTGLDPVLQGFTQTAAQIIDPGRTVNPLCNWFFTALACIPIVGTGWWVTDRIVEPHLRKSAVDGDPKDMPVFDPLQPVEKRALLASLSAIAVGLVLLTVALLIPESPLAPQVMHALIPLIFLFFLIPGALFGYLTGSIQNHRDVVKMMAKSMSSMGYYIVLVFFAAQFIYAFTQSNLGALLAVKGANLLSDLQVPGAAIILGIILMTTLVNLLIGSASAKWALLGPIFVPMLMLLGLSPELTQAAYRVGDSCTNIATPLNPYFALVVMYCQRYVQKSGVGTLLSLMIPYSIAFLVSWTALLLLVWGLGIPLGLGPTSEMFFAPYIQTR